MLALMDMHELAPKIIEIIQSLEADGIETTRENIARYSNRSTRTITRVTQEMAKLGLIEIRNLGQYGNRYKCTSQTGKNN
jgi:predicted transcriptional regulator